MTPGTPRFSQPPEGQMCQNCDQRPATGLWVGEGGVMAAVHGAGSWWCEPCMLIAQIEYAEQAAARLPELRQRLAWLNDFHTINE